MFHRIVVILTVLAVIACPMFCGEGTACCAGHKHSVVVCETAQPECSCCRHQSPSQQEEPCDSPDDSGEPCQGVCGGVVMLESTKIDTRDDLLHAIPFEIVLTESILTQRSAEQHWNGSSMVTASGRSLRTFLSSYLC